MVNKELQESRMRSYFIEACSEMLKSEGLKSLSVRNIAERAGYSYATLYNYFKDVKVLVFECVNGFRKECENYIAEACGEMEPGLAQIRKKGEYYFRYFTEYPGIFELFFLERPSEMASSKNPSSLIYSFTDELCDEDWAYCIREGILSPEDAESRKRRFRDESTGILLFYLNRHHPATYEEFIQITQRQLLEITRAT